MLPSMRCNSSETPCCWPSQPDTIQPKDSMDIWQPSSTADLHSVLIVLLWSAPFTFSFLIIFNAHMAQLASRLSHSPRPGVKLTARNQEASFKTGVMVYGSSITVKVKHRRRRATNGIKPNPTIAEQRHKNAQKLCFCEEVFKASHSNSTLSVPAHSLLLCCCSKYSYVYVPGIRGQPLLCPSWNETFMPIDLCRSTWLFKSQQTHLHASVLCIIPFTVS